MAKTGVSTLRRYEMKNGGCIHNGRTYRYSLFHYLGEPTEWMVEILDVMNGDTDEIDVRDFLTEDYIILS